MTTKTYVNRIIDCVNQMIQNGLIESAEELQQKYGLPVLSEEVLNNESEESINKVIDALSEKNPGARIYIQTGSQSKIIDNSQIQMGHGNLCGDNNKTKESAAEEDCNTKLERALAENRYLKKALDDKDKELARMDGIITELISKIK